jgi:hypothetical protein
MILLKKLEKTCYFFPLRNLIWCLGLGSGGFIRLQRNTVKKTLKFLSSSFFCSLLLSWFVSVLLQELEDHTHEVNVHHEVLDGMFTLYDSTKAKLNIYQVLTFYFSSWQLFSLTCLSPSLSVYVIFIAGYFFLSEKTSFLCIWTQVSRERI